MKQNTNIQSLVDIKQKTACTVSPTKSSRRQNSKVFRLKRSDVSLGVCKEMFLNVLGISKWKVDAALEKSTGIAKEIVKPRNPTPSRGFVWSSADQDCLADFFRDIPKAPGHYCYFFMHQPRKRLFGQIICHI